MDVIDKAIGIYLVAALIPASLASLNDANTTGWTTTQIALWSLVGIGVIVAIVKWAFL